MEKSTFLLHKISGAYTFIHDEDRLGAAFYSDLWISSRKAPVFSFPFPCV